MEALLDRQIRRQLIVLLCVVSLLCVLSLLGGCSSKSGLSPREKSTDPRVEYLGRDQVVRDEVSQHPTSFVTDQSVAVLWKRVELLSSNYLNTDTKPTVLQKSDIKGFHMRHFPGQVKAESHYGYEIVAKRGENQDQVSVSVDVMDLSTKTRNSNSILLAKNVARFLNTGTLERNLLNP